MLNTRSWGMLLAELLVVFLGVYGAFWVDNFRDEQNRKERAQQVKAALVADLQDYVKVTQSFHDYIKAGLQEWEAATERGEAPPPFVFRLYGAETPPLTTWDVVRQAQLAELIGPNLLYELGFFYNEISGSGLRYVRYAIFTEAEVLPLLKVDHAVFYNAEGTRLLPRFEAHMDRLREYNRFFAGSATWASCLIERLQTETGNYAECRNDIGISVLDPMETP